MTTAHGARLDWNESPFGPSPKAIARVMTGAAELHRYPRGLREDVTGQVAGAYGVDPEQVLLTNGVDEATDLVLSTVSTMWFVTPGFDGYADRARAMDREARPVPLDEDWEPVTAPARIATGGAVFLAQPHNPTGNFFRQQWVREVVDTAQLTFLDETYLDFCTEPSALDILPVCPNLVVFKSFSKAHGLAGVRLGAMIAAPSLIKALRERQSFHSVNSVALHALSGAIEDVEHRARLRHYVSVTRPRYATLLAGSPLFDDVRAPSTNFVLARCRPQVTTADVVYTLRRHGVALYDCGSLGLDGWLRIGVGDAQDLRALADALRATVTELLPDQASALSK